MTLAVVFAYFSYPRGSNGTGEVDQESESKGLSDWLKSWGFWRSTLILLSAIPIAIVTNALRVSGTGILARYYGTKVADGFFHSFSGWVIYVAAFLLLFGFGWVLDRLATLFSTQPPNKAVASDQVDLIKPSLGSAPKVAQSEGTD
jgi:exosortase/archaeosortase family protein